MLQVIMPFAYALRAVPYYWTDGSVQTEEVGVLLICGVILWFGGCRQRRNMPCFVLKFRGINGIVNLNIMDISGLAFENAKH